MRKINEFLNHLSGRVKKEMSAVLFGACTALYSTALSGQQVQTNALTQVPGGFGAQPNGIVAKAAPWAGGKSDIQKMLQYYDKQIYFTENKGQWPEHVLYKADFTLGQALATSQGMIVGT